MVKARLGWVSRVHPTGIDEDVVDPTIKLHCLFEDTMQLVPFSDIHLYEREFRVILIRWLQVAIHDFSTQLEELQNGCEADTRGTPCVWNFSLLSNYETNVAMYEILEEAYLSIRRPYFPASEDHHRQL